MMFLNERKKVLSNPMSTVGFMTIATSVIAIISSPTGKVHALATPKRVYRYFGYGSNVIPSTMKALRQIEVRDVTAAVLPDFELKFQSAAFVRPTNKKKKSGGTDQVVHGLLYTLTEEEFAKVGQTEGVPFGYRWQSCRVYPYQGDGKKAGADCLEDPDALSVQAFTLVEPTPASSKQKQKRKRQREQPKASGERGSAPPSTSYLGLIREGARLWKFDRSYQDELATIQTATSSNFLFPDGWEGPTLQLAEKATGIERTYMIDGY